MTRILAIDPGPTQSAWLELVDGLPARFAKVTNDEVLVKIYGEHLVSDAVVIEQIEPRYGLNPGWETLDTARWVGRFEEAAGPIPVARLQRSQILRHLGVVTRGPNRTTADSGVRSALIDRYGGPAAIGVKAAPGPLHGISKDVWAALAVAVTWLDQRPAPGRRSASRTSRAGGSSPRASPPRRSSRS